MSDVTLQAIEDLLDSKLDEKLEPIQKTLAGHTLALEKLTTEKKLKEENNLVSTDRFKKLEGWAEKVGKKLDVKIEF